MDHALVLDGCDHVAFDGEPVAALVGTFGLCRACEARFTERGILVPDDQPMPERTPVHWADLERGFAELIAAFKTLQS